MNNDDSDDESAKFAAFVESLAKFNVEGFSDSVIKREKDIEVLARKWQKEARGYRDKYHRAQSEAHDKIAYRSFKEGDLALFLPTRNQAIRSWAAFNVGAPHYFLREQDVHKLSTRDWLLARISKVEERVVDLSRSMNGANQDRRSIASDVASFDDENPFELSDGLRWYLLDATEEKPGAPSTPGLGKSTVASAHVDAKGSIRLKRSSAGGNVAKTLTKSLDSRRYSSASKKGTPVPALLSADSIGDNVQPAETDVGSQPRGTAAIFDEVRRDLLRKS
jgi:autophagy-related protein 11